MQYEFGIEFLVWQERNRLDGTPSTLSLNADWTQILTIRTVLIIPKHRCGFRLRFNFWNLKRANPNFQKGPAVSQRPRPITQT